MASKWEKLKGKVPDAPASDMSSAADPKFLEKVDAAKVELSELPLVGLMTKLIDLNLEWDELEDRKKELNVEFEALGQLIKRHFEQNGVSAMKSTDGQTFYTHIEPLIGIKPGRKDDAEQWVLSDPGLDYLWAIQPQSLASWAKDKLENPPQAGEPEVPIPDFLSIMLKTSIRVRKS